jgi:hypothetical protein
MANFNEIYFMLILAENSRMIRIVMQRVQIIVLDAEFH